MKQEEMEAKLKQAFSNASSSLFEDILADCKDEGKVLKMEKTEKHTERMNRQNAEISHMDTRHKQGGRKSWLRLSLAALTASLIIFVGGFFVMQLMNANQVASIVTMDVNPSIQLEVNSKDQVLHTRALNDDGARILEEMDLNKVDLDVAVNAIIGSMFKNGYMTEEIATWLVSVENKSDRKTSEILDKLVFQLVTLMGNNGIESIILSQKLTMDDDVDGLAKKYQLTPGKAYLVKHIHKNHLTIPEEVLSGMRIHELVELFSTTIANDDDIELHGSVVADSHRESLDRASVLTMLFEKWKLDPAGIRSATIVFDEDHMVYEVEASESSQNYRAFVDAKSGEILDGTTPTANALMLSASDARQMVISRFGGIIQKIEYAYDDTYPLYKGEALKAGEKVVFEINAKTKEWVKWDIDNDNSWDDFAHAIPEMMTMDQAAASVISKSGHTGTFIQKIDFLWDDAEPLYQGEAYRKGMKYSFEIHAYDGSYQKWDIDSDDDTWEEKYDNVR